MGIRTIAQSIIIIIIELSTFLAFCHGWGMDGHLIICQIAQARLDDAAADAVRDLLPAYAEDDLSSLCSWADHVKFRYPWSSALHYINTPDNLCSYSYDRDCKDDGGEKGRCVSGAIKNYTSQLLAYGSSSTQTKYNLTEALLFLSHFMGDIHQPLHVGFTSDEGGNTIDVHWYTRKTVLHHVWDDSIIETAEERFYDSNVAEFVDAITQNITGNWSNQVQEWEDCSDNETTCPDMYASESITAACDWAYKNATEGSVLEGVDGEFRLNYRNKIIESQGDRAFVIVDELFQNEYFLTRLPVVNLRFAQSAVRLAATLNRAFRRS